ncbi:MAG: hypothetical protein ABI423_09100 [Burkholderiales bacterium]
MADEGVPHNAGVAAAQERVEHFREAEQSDLADAALAHKVLQAEHGTADYATGVRVLQKYLAQLPAAEREHVENATTSAGVRALHDPVTLRAIVKREMGPMPTSREGALAELEGARRRMREDPKAWFADDLAQLRYRALVAAMGGQR